jgi:hypothetical protein
VNIRGSDKEFIVRRRLFICIVKTSTRIDPWGTPCIWLPHVRQFLAHSVKFALGSGIFPSSFHAGSIIDRFHCILIFAANNIHFLNSYIT